MSDSLQNPANSALVLFSGGQDSATCLAWALARFERVETVGFDYGQRHAVEMQARQAVRAGFAARFPEWAKRLGEDHVLDIKGFGQVAETALSLGLDKPVVIETPLMALTKADTWALAHDLGGQPLVDLILEASHTCYRGDRENRQSWGYGCGDCPACELRAVGHAEWVARAGATA